MLWQHILTWNHQTESLKFDFSAAEENGATALKKSTWTQNHIPSFHIAARSPLYQSHSDVLADIVTLPHLHGGSEGRFMCLLFPFTESKCKCFQRNGFISIQQGTPLKDRHIEVRHLPSRASRERAHFWNYWEHFITWRTVQCTDIYHVVPLN